MPRLIKIGSRDSSLALWQAQYIEELFKKQGVQTELILVKSEGDLNLTQPLYEMGVRGIFTKTLDIALLSGKIDVAVHSLKDVPTLLPKGLKLAAIPKRANVHDVLVYKDEHFQLDGHAGITIATSSLRRRSQWLHRFPAHTIESIRGNINTRLEKLRTNKSWSGALFAAAGIDRIGLDVPNRMELDWMLPAPAQGALAVVCREDDKEALKICVTVDHRETANCTTTERNFLRGLKGGCSIPIGALAEYRGDKIAFRGNIFSLDGMRKAEVEMEFPVEEAGDAGYAAAKKLLASGGEQIARELKDLMTED